MAKVSINKLNLPKNDVFTDVEINGIQVSVKKYIDTADKSAIIDRAAGSGTNAFGVDEIIAESILHYWILLKQTNLALKEDVKLEDALKIVDQFTKSGFLTVILAAIEKEDYDHLIDECAKFIEKADRFLISTGLAVNKFSEDLSQILILALEKSGKIQPLPTEFDN